MRLLMSSLKMFLKSVPCNFRTNWSKRAMIYVIVKMPFYNLMGDFIGFLKTVIFKPIMGCKKGARFSQYTMYTASPSAPSVCLVFVHRPVCCLHGAVRQSPCPGTARMRCSESVSTGVTPFSRAEECVSSVSSVSKHRSQTVRQKDRPQMPGSSARDRSTTRRTLSLGID